MNLELGEVWAGEINAKLTVPICIGNWKQTAKDTEKEKWRSPRTDLWGPSEEEVRKESKERQGGDALEATWKKKVSHRRREQSRVSNGACRSGNLRSEGWKMMLAVKGHWCGHGTWVVSEKWWGRGWLEFRREWEERKWWQWVSTLFWRI